MELMTKEIMAAFKKQGKTNEMNAEEIKIIVKYFNPEGSGTWFCYDIEDDNDTLWCFANIVGDDFAESGTVSLMELQSIRGRLGLGIERDLHFGDHTLDEIMEFKVR